MRKSKEISVEIYAHKGKKRKNNPPIGLVSSATDKLNGRTIYKHDPHIDPALSWAGKAEGMSFEVQNVSLHIHERIDPKRIIKSFLNPPKKKEEQLLLFEQPDNDPPLNKAIDFYKHEQDWANRLIAGDSLLVMNSLLKKEGMSGKVQMVYIDPPYGIKYNSNFQPFVNKRDVKDNNDSDIPAEPEMIQAFRDTWELGIHSYLTYLRDRLLLTRDLLHESGSCFVQISDENVHLVRNLMDDIFGSNNFLSLISFATTSGFQSVTLSRAGDYICWYAKKKEKVKYHQLYRSKSIGLDGASGYDFLEFPDGSQRNLTEEEKDNYTLIPKEARLFAKSDLQSQNPASEDQSFKFNGKIYRPNLNSHWKANFPDGIEKLVKAGRIVITGNTLRYKRYFEDFPIFPLNNFWEEQMSE